MTDALLRRAAALLTESRHAVALTGAGISTPSGIPDFRTPGKGLWERVDPEEVISARGFRSDPQRFFQWLGALLRDTQAALPNPAHVALARLEERGILHAVITQNIDSLHTRAGSRRVFELHGSMRTAHCIRCRKPVDIDGDVLGTILAEKIPHCGCGGILKPDVVLYGESLPAAAIAAAEIEAQACDLMLVAGSSLTVMPAAALPYVARRHGARLIIVNQMETDADPIADVVIHEDVAQALPAIADLCSA